MLGSASRFSFSHRRRRREWQIHSFVVAMGPVFATSRFTVSSFVSTTRRYGPIRLGGRLLSRRFVSATSRFTVPSFSPSRGLRASSLLLPRHARRVTRLVVAHPLGILPPRLSLSLLADLDARPSPRSVLIVAQQSRDNRACPRRSVVAAWTESVHRCGRRNAVAIVEEKRRLPKTRDARK